MTYANRIAIIRSHFATIAAEVRDEAAAIVAEHGIAPAQALTLAADTVAHDRGDGSQTQAVALAKALMG